MVRRKKKAIAMHTHKIKNLFETLDTSGDGEINYEEFQVIATCPAMNHWLSAMGMETDDLKTLFLLLDVDQTGSITVDELVHGVGRLKEHPRIFDLLTVKELKDPLTAPSRRSLLR